MKLSEALKVALATRDLRRLGRIVDQLRESGLNYWDVLKFAQKAQPALTSDDWEDLMVQVEDLEAAS